VQLGEGLHVSQLSLLPGSEMLNKLTVNVTLVSKYSANSPGLTTYIKQVSTKARRLVGMQYSFIRGQTQQHY